MIFYKEDLSNLSNPLNFFPSFFSLFWHEKQNVVRLIPTLMSTFIFLVIPDKDLSARNLNDNLTRTNNCGFQWKFNPDLSKEIHEIIFSSQNSKISEPSINNIATQSSIQQPSGMFFYTKLDFQEHLKKIFSKVDKKSCLLRMLHHILPKLRLFTIYESFIIPNFGYQDLIYDQIYHA